MGDTDEGGEGRGEQAALVKNKKHASMMTRTFLKNLAAACTRATYALRTRARAACKSEFSRMASDKAAARAHLPNPPLLADVSSTARNCNVPTIRPITRPDPDIARTLALW